MSLSSLSGMRAFTRWLLGVSLFLLIMIPVAWALGTDWLIDHAESLFWPALFLAAAGFFLLGFVTRSFWSVILVPLPALLMWLFEKPPAYSDSLPMTGWWMYFTFVFAFVWLVGAGIGWNLRRTGASE